MRAVLDGGDVLAVMPTGAGKSLAYQLPALLLEGLTLVVSPLVALMKDQVDELRRKGMSAAALHSLQTAEERREATRAARDGRLKLFYVSPERFASEGFRSLLAGLSVSRFAVDEAHCVSQWGHDFRPDYRLLAEAAGLCRRAGGEPGRPPILAVTATATPEVRRDIAELLGLREARVFVAGFDRPNIALSVTRLAGEEDKHELLARLVAGRRALVYAATRKSSERAAAALGSAGTAAEAYHAGLDDATRVRVQDAFVRGDLRVVTATNAFGMGIDRPDVEAVVHVELPPSLEAYYQEIGRAGRDGRPAQATLLWSWQDVKTREYLIEKGDDADPRRQRREADPRERERRRELEKVKLRRMVSWAESSGCRRAALLTAFGERPPWTSCGSCDRCEAARPLPPEELLLLRKVLSGVARGGERWGKRKVAAMLVGELEGLPESLAGLSTTGLLRELGTRNVEAWLEAALSAGLLRVSDDQYRLLSLTREGREVMAGRSVEVTLCVPEEEGPPRAKKKRKSRAVAVMNAASFGAAAAPAGAVADASLLTRLKDWRRAEAAVRHVPAYVVFSDRTLEALAALRPGTRGALAEVPGIGSVKLDLYGETLLGLLKPG